MGKDRTTADIMLEILALAKTTVDGRNDTLTKHAGFLSPLLLPRNFNENQFTGYQTQIHPNSLASLSRTKANEDCLMNVLQVPSRAHFNIKRESQSLKMPQQAPEPNDVPLSSLAFKSGNTVKPQSVDTTCSQCFCHMPLSSNFCCHCGCPREVYDDPISKALGDQCEVGNHQNAHLYQNLPLMPLCPSPAQGPMTTLMLRNIPGPYTPETLLHEWPNGGTYDFVYLPYSSRMQRNLTYVFINFTTPEFALAFMTKWQKARLSRFSAQKPLNIGYADVQGRIENLRQLKKKRLLHTKVKQCQPLVFKDGERIPLEEAVAEAEMKSHQWNIDRSSF